MFDKAVSSVKSAAAPAIKSGAIYNMNPALGAAYGTANILKAQGVNIPGLGGSSGSSSGDPNAGDQNWWKQDRPENRAAEFTNADGSVKDAYKLNNVGSRIPELDQRMNAVGPVNFNNTGNAAAMSGLGALQAKAYDPNLSAGARAQNNLVDMNRAKDIDRLNQSNNGALSNARDNMAAGGGLSGGGRERLEMQGMRNRMMANAGAYGNASTDKGKIAAADYAAKDELQNRLPELNMKLGAQETDLAKYNTGLGMDKINLWNKQGNVEDAREMDVRSSNLSTAMKDKQATDAFLMDRWKQQNAAIGGEKTAASQNYYADQQSKRGLLGNNGGILGTGIGF